jgi:hypothetical protein
MQPQFSSLNHLRHILENRQFLTCRLTLERHRKLMPDCLKVALAWHENELIAGKNCMASERLLAFCV